MLSKSQLPQMQPTRSDYCHRLRIPVGFVQRPEQTGGSYGGMIIAASFKVVDQRHSNLGAGLEALGILCKRIIHRRHLSIVTRIGLSGYNGPPHAQQIPSADEKKPPPTGHMIAYAALPLPGNAPP